MHAFEVFLRQYVLAHETAATAHVCGTRTAVKAGRRSRRAKKEKEQIAVLPDPEFTDTTLDWWSK
jgi:hypothetical protein